MARVTLVFTSDTHGFVLPTRYADTRARPMGVLGAAQAFGADESTLILDGGDTTQGSALTYYCHSHALPSPMAQAMNAAGYQYVTLGNHDFNYGIAALAAYLNELRALCLCANVRDLEGRLPLAPYAIHVMPNGVRVGLLGLVTDWVTRWERPENLSGIQIEPPLPAARRALDALCGQVDLTVCLYHGGYEKDLQTGARLSDSDENIACLLCEELPIDILLTGHQHLALGGAVWHGTHIVQTPANATQFARVTWEDGRVVSALETPVIPARIPAPLAALEARVQSWLDTPIARLDAPLLPDEPLKMALHGSPIANFFNHVQLAASGADVSCTSLANDVRGFDAAVTVRDVVATYVYPNTLCKLAVTGRVLRAAIERSAAYFALEGGRVRVADEFLLPKVAHYNYDYFAGVSYVIDISRPVGERVVSLTRRGLPVREDDAFTLCMNSYRATGVAGYAMYRDCPRLWESSTEISELILDFFTKNPQISVERSSTYRVIGGTLSSESFR